MVLRYTVHGPGRSGEGKGLAKEDCLPYNGREAERQGGAGKGDVPSQGTSPGRPHLQAHEIFGGHLMSKL